jgi:hypothetical protein
MINPFLAPIIAPAQAKSISNPARPPRLLARAYRVI